MSGRSLKDYLGIRKNGRKPKRCKCGKPSFGEAQCTLCRNPDFIAPAKPKRDPRSKR